MDVTSLLQADITIQIHAITALIAIFSGAIVIWNKKGSTFHKLLGRLWFVTMVIVVISSAFISEIKLWGPFSPIHIFTVLGAWALVQGIYYIRKGNIAAHGATMKNLYFLGAWCCRDAGIYARQGDEFMVFPQRAL